MISGGLFPILLFALLALVPPALADQCDAIVARIASEVPGVTFKARMEGSFKLKHREASSLYWFVSQMRISWIYALGNL
jgi:hypothetical protein